MQCSGMRRSYPLNRVDDQCLLPAFQAQIAVQQDCVTAESASLWTQSKHAQRSWFEIFLKTYRRVAVTQSEFSNTCLGCEGVLGEAARAHDARRLLIQEDLHARVSSLQAFWQLAAGRAHLPRVVVADQRARFAVLDEQEDERERHGCDVQASESV